MLTSSSSVSLESQADDDHAMVRTRSSNGLIRSKRSSTKMDHSAEEKDLADCLIMLSKSADVTEVEDPLIATDFPFGVPVASKGQKFECKACKKVFSSHQALGGHRASHKKVKGCFRAKKVIDQSDDEDDHEYDQKTNTSSEEKAYDHDDNHQKKRSKGHECSICHRIFSSGQALGGHKRCHWLSTSSSLVPVEDNKIPKPKWNTASESEPFVLELDLNLAAQDLASESHVMKGDDQCKGVLNQVEEKEERSGCKATLRKLSEVMDMHMRPGTSSSWLRLASGDYFNH